MFPKRKTEMGNSFNAEWWAVTLPPGWVSRQEEHGVSFHQVPELGTLQISSAFKDTAVTDQDLLELASEVTSNHVRLRKLNSKRFSGFVARSKKNDTYIREWW